MTTNTDELFELCKQVYKNLGWQIEDSKWFCKRNFDDGYDIEDYPLVAEYIEDGNIPLYTSDYLLEKLPDFEELHHWSLTLDHDGRDEKGLCWGAYYVDNDDNDLSIAAGLYASADTPLKALLKLTLALQEAKLL